MSVNSLGVNAYTKVESFNPRSRPEAARSSSELIKQSEVSSKSPAASKITIPQKLGAESSALAVTSDNSLANILSADEKQAIDELFAKYDFSKGEDAGYSQQGETSAAVAVGRKVDFTV